MSKFWLKDWWKTSLHLSFRQWIFIVIPLLCLAILPLTMFSTQYKNYALKSQHYSVDSIFPMSYLLEREHARFAYAVHHEYEHIHLQSSASIQVLKNRYEILVSRFLLAKSTPSFDLLKNVPEFQKASANMEEFIKVADPIMQRLDESNANPDDFKLIFELLEKNSNSLLELTNAAQTIVYRITDERAAQIKDQGRLIFGLIGAQWFLLVGALMALMLYIGKQRNQNADLLQLTNDLRKASDQAERANQSKSMFLANMSHELRTPFQGLMGMLHLLSETPLTTVQMDYANTALTSANHLLGILNDILDTSAIESGSMALNIAPLNLPSLIVEVEALMQPTAHQKKIDLRVVGIKDLPECIEGDAKRLSQVLFNLLSNAIKFTDNGGVLLELSTLPPASGEEQHRLSFKVHDTGIGMNPQTVQNLFTRFYQADNTIHRRYGGSGLGLEISLNLARLMGGGISVDSIEGEGTIFTFEFPYRPAVALESSAATEFEPVQNLRILIADDHPINVKYLEILLSNLGHTTISCENGARVLELLQHIQVDVILMDLHMPEMNGISTTKAIRNLGGALADIKIIMVSADILPEARRFAFEAGVTGFISKPVQAHSLCQVLNQSFKGGLNHHYTAHHESKFSHVKQDAEVFNARVFNEFRELMPAEMVDKQLVTFFGEDKEAFLSISKVIDSDIRKDIVESAHAMKGVCWLLGFTAMGNTLSKIEKGAPEASIELLGRLLAQFQEETYQTRQILLSDFILH